MKYLLFGVFTCLIGVGFTGCGEDYDKEINDLKTKLEKVTTDLSLAATKTEMTTAVNAVVQQAKDAAKAEIAAMASTSGSSITPAEMSKALGELAALSKYFAGDVRFASAMNGLDAAAGEVATKAGTPVGLLANMIQLQTDIAMMKNQMAVLGTVTGTGNAAQFSVIKAIQDRLDAIAPGTGGGTTDYEKLAVELAKNQTFMTAIMAQIGSAVNMMEVNSMITELSLVENLATPFELSFGSATHTGDNYFFGPEEYAGRFEFKKDAVISLTPSVVVRVTPAGASLSASMLSLVNGKGEINVDQYVKIKEVKRYNKDITRATPSTGLYEVVFELDPSANGDDFNNTISGNKTFAIAAGTGADRYVLTDFGLKVKTTGAANLPADLGDFTVNTKKVNEIAGSDGASVGSMDRGSALPKLTVKAGESFEVKMGGVNMNNAFAYYIDLDVANSTATERAKITGLQKVYRIGETATILAPNSVKGMSLGFRVYAVNPNGTRPNKMSTGRSFYVVYDQPVTPGAPLKFNAEIPSSVNLPMQPADRLETNEVNIPYWKSETDAMIKSFELTMDVENLKFTITGSYTPGAPGSITWQLPAGFTGHTSMTATIGKLKIAGINPANLKEDKTYIGTLTLKDGAQTSLATYPVELRKPTPTTIPTTIAMSPIASTNISGDGYAIANAGQKTITVIPAPKFENNKLTSASYDFTASEFGHLFNNATGISLGMENANGPIKVESPSPAERKITLTSGYYNKDGYNLPLKYNFGKFKYKDGRVAEDLYAPVSGYKIQYASALAGYGIDFKEISNVSFTVGSEISLSVVMNLSSFKAPSNPSVNFTQTEIEKWLDTTNSNNSFNGVVTYFNNDGIEKTIALKHDGYDAQNFPKLKMSSTDAGAVSTFGAAGRACGINMTLTDRLGATVTIKTNVNIAVDPASAKISIKIVE